MILYLLEDENTMEEDLHLGTYVGTHNSPLRAKLGVLDPTDGNTELHDRRVGIRCRSGKR